MFRSAKTVIRPPLQDFQNKTNVYEIYISQYMHILYCLATISAWYNIWLHLLLHHAADTCDPISFTYTGFIQSVPLATELDISLIILPLRRILERNLTHTTDTFLFILHSTNLLMFKFRCSIFIGVRIIKEMPGSVASGTLCIIFIIFFSFHSFFNINYIHPQGLHFKTAG